MHSFSSIYIALIKTFSVLRTVYFKPQQCRNNVGRAVQTDQTLFRYASAITEQKKCWELSAEKFDRPQTLRNNTQTTSNNMHQGVQTDATFNIQQC